MENNLANNIRTFRKQKNLTQEQLAEVMGVTTGAVHKWEAGMSVPEIGLIMELADYFDVSVDILLGYHAKDNRVDAIIKRMCEYCKKMNPEAMSEAEKALSKYPNSLELVYACAEVYMVFGAGGKSKKEAERALELLNRTLVLLPQNSDTEISEISIYGSMAGTYLMLDETEKAVELMKKHNVCGVFSDSIGLGLAVFLKRYKEAEPFLKEAIINSFGSLINAISGMCTLFCYKGDYDSALDILKWGMEIQDRITKNEAIDFMSKSRSMDLLMLANIYLLKGMKEDAAESVRKAAEITRNFDSVPDYSIRSLKFVGETDDANIHDSLGRTAKESAESLIRLIGNAELEKMWAEVTQNEK